MKKKQQKSLTSLSQAELVTLAVYLLEGAKRAVDTEDAAVKAHELAPGRFAWRKYPEQINLELVRVYLSDAKKPGKGALLSGSGRTGWMLTQAGYEWARQAAPQAEGMNLARGREESHSGSIDENRWRRERARIVSTAAWDRWTRGERELSHKEVSEVFRIDSYAIGRLRESKITRLRSLFEEDEKIALFLAHAAELLHGRGVSE